MSKQHIPTNQNTISNNIGKYFRAMETDLFVFFVNFEEGDESGQVKMYRRASERLELVSDNYFAFVGIMDEFREANEIWMSTRMKKERQLYIDEQILPLVKEYLELNREDDIVNRMGELEEELNEFYVVLPEINVRDFLRDKFNL